MPAGFRVIAADDNAKQGPAFPATVRMYLRAVTIEADLALASNVVHVFGVELLGFDGIDDIRRPLLSWIIQITHLQVVIESHSKWSKSVFCG